MNVPANLFYTKEHEWAKIDGKTATVGITDHAQHALGDITFVECPPAGKAVKQFDRYSTVESVKAASDVYAPVSGKVIKVNEELKTKPELVNQSPYERGFFACIEMSDPAEKAKLMDSQAYAAYVKELEK
ncbi:MAG: glycine cleavage system protein GcvH [Candidatus Omnitrophica bacterium]|nr:glycine cleavage system protein GcvH [Candidatus Omnitrophota bacterium]